MTAQCEGMGEVGSVRYEPALLLPCLSIRMLKGCMILRCVKKAIYYKYPYAIANVAPYQIYTVVMMTTCANQEYNCLDMEYSVTSVVTSKKANGLCGYDYGESPV